MDFEETIPYFYPDQALRDFWAKWSDAVLWQKQSADDNFQEVLGSQNANDRTRVGELYSIGVLRGRMVTPQELGRKEPLGWSLLIQGEHVHTTLGYLAYLLGKTKGLDSKGVNEAFSALCALFSIQIGYMRPDGVQFSYASLIEYLKKYFPRPVDIQENLWLRYLAAGMFSTINSDGSENLVTNLLENQPIKRLTFRWQNGEEIEADYTSFCNLIYSRKSISTLKKPKHSLFFIGSETFDSDARGTYTQALKHAREFITFFAYEEINQLQQGKRGQECFNYLFLYKDPLTETTDVVKEIIKLTNQSNDWKRIITHFMKTLQTGCIEAVSMLYGTTEASQIPVIAKESKNSSSLLPDLPRNYVLYGPPGTGKSTRIDKIYAAGHAQIRVTFHPDSDYHSFIGAYKPVSDDGDIHYSFVPQAFTNAYISAWSQPDKAIFLIIEEINRGNCAQIFGDLFQCLDRNAQHFSVYPVDADTDLAKYLKKVFAENHSAADTFARETRDYDKVGPTDYHKLILPNNLYIYATMNTSDQSLFPMDSAFKRRWDWEFVPIDYAQANKFTIALSDTLRYSWGQFIRNVNSEIYSLNRSEDKQLGNRFVNPSDGVITLSNFKSKVMFYLWSEIYKNETDSSDTIFISKPDPSSDVTMSFTFSELYETDSAGNNRDVTLLEGFMRKLGLEPIRE